MKNNLSIVSVATTIFLSLTSFASAALTDDLASFRKYKEVNFPGPVPAVVEISFPEYLEREQFAVTDPLNIVTPYYFRREVYVNKIRLIATANMASAEAAKMTDENTLTYAEFGVRGDAQETAKIILVGHEPIESSALNLLLDEHVALPSFVEIKIPIGEAGQEKIILANTKVFGRTINFPKTVSREWHILFRYSQPLRISELSLLQENAVKTSSGFLRFLAQPVTAYKIYFDPDRPVNIRASEAGNLYSDKGVLQIKNIRTINNPIYRISDIDKDGIPDLSDNCVTIANGDQKDVDQNGRGDACDDFDRDGVINNEDNCVNLPNADQRDIDDDKIGDVCDKEEGRITERYPWLPWAGIVFAALVLIILFALTARTSQKTIDGKIQ